MKVTFQRDSLFEEVWKTPMTTLSKKYGLSDNGLRKICIGMDIPLPKAGHWAKLAVGKAPQRPPLLPTNGRSTLTTDRGYAPDSPRIGTQMNSTEDEIWLTERVRDESRTKMAIKVLSNPSIWHPVIELLRNWLERCSEEYEEALKGEDAHRRIMKIRGPHYWDPNYSHWKYAQHYPILGSTHHSSAMRVSIGTYAHALNVANALALAAEARGFTVELDKNRERIFLCMESCRIGLYINERLEITSDLVRRPGSSTAEVVKTKTPSGKLAVCVEKYLGNAYRIEGDPRSAWGTLLHRVFEKAFQLVARHRIEARQRAIAEQEAEKLLLAKAELERQRREQEQKLLEEKKRCDDLINWSNDWHQASRIRQFIDHVEQSVIKTPHHGLQPEWSNWARAVADRLDPTLQVIEQVGVTDPLSPDTKIIEGSD